MNQTLDSDLPSPRCEYSNFNSLAYYMYRTPTLRTSLEAKVLDRTHQAEDNYDNCLIQANTRGASRISVVLPYPLKCGASYRESRGKPIPGHKGRTRLYLLIRLLKVLDSHGGKEAALSLATQRDERRTALVAVESALTCIFGAFYNRSKTCMAPIMKLSRSSPLTSCAWRLAVLGAKAVCKGICLRNSSRDELCIESSHFDMETKVSMYTRSTKERPRQPSDEDRTIMGHHRQVLHQLPKVSDVLDGYR